MKKSTLKILFFFTSIFSILYLFFIFIRNYNLPENIEKRCTLKFQKDIKPGLEVYDKNWEIRIELAEIKYFNCMKIP